MRMEIVTHDRMISLGVMAKDHFMTNILQPDENGQFDALQEVQADTLDKIKALPLQGGIDQRIKDGAIDAFSRMSVGDKFLCVGAWVGDYKSEEAKYYWKVQELCNQDNTLEEAQEKAKEWLKEYRASAQSEAQY